MSALLIPLSLNLPDPGPPLPSGTGTYGPWFVLGLNLASPTPPVIGTFRTGLVAAIAQDTTISTLVGTQFFPLRISEKAATPALTYQVLSLPRGHTLGGAHGIVDGRVQFAAVSRSLASCTAIVEALRQLFDSYTGTLPGGVQVLETILQDELDLYEPPIDGGDRGTYRTVVDYTFKYRESLPPNASP
jgi:hypothetical protein